MKASSGWPGAALFVAGLLISGCGVLARPQDAAPAAKNGPSRVEPVGGSDLSRVVLTDDAVKRLDIQTAEARDEEIDGARHTVIPYAAVLYDLHGDTWTYTNPEHGTFVRQSIDVDTIRGDVAVLSQGPPAGTAIVTVGVAELFGAEFEFQEQ